MRTLGHEHGLTMTSAAPLPLRRSRMRIAFPPPGLKTAYVSTRESIVTYRMNPANMTAYCRTHGRPATAFCHLGYCSRFSCSPILGVARLFIQVVRSSKQTECSSGRTYHSAPPGGVPEQWFCGILVRKSLQLQPRSEYAKARSSCIAPTIGRPVRGDRRVTLDPLLLTLLLRPLKMV
jgi:hypothetical protein